MKIYALAALAAFGCAATASAQQRPAEIFVGQTVKQETIRTEATPPVKAPPERTTRIMPENTIVQLSPLQEITSKRMKVGDKVAFAVVSDVVEEGVVVIQRGATVQASITWKTGRAIGGKSGKFEVTFDNVTVRGKRYAMRGQHRQEGRGNTVGALLGSIVISGRSAVMLPGDLVNAFTADPIPYEV